MTRFRRLLMPTIAAVALLGTACSNDGTATPGGPDLDVQLVASLQPFDACDDFLGYVKKEALDRVGPYGLDGNGMIAYDTDMPTAARETATTAAGMGDDASANKSTPAPMAESAGAGDEFDAGTTGTNNQEQGVDEADIVKVDGNRIVTVRGSELIVVTMQDGAPHVTAKLSLGDGNLSADRLFLLPDRAYVLGADYSGSTGQAVVIEVTLGDTPAVAHTTRLDGNILDGRMTGDALRLVVTSPGATGLGFVYPSDGDERSTQRAEDTNRSIVEDSDVDDWVPTMSTDGGKRTPLIACDHLYRPAEMSGFSMLSIVTVTDGLGSLTATGVLADGQTTYASTGHLYVATTSWAPVEATTSSKRIAPVGDEHTDVHSFATAGSTPAAYEASGRVDGHLLNQYSLSESTTGDLRIATTVNGNSFVGTWECPPDADCIEPAMAEETSTSTEEAPRNDSGIVVLRRDGDVLREVGSITGLGVGEQIKSVRYTGDVAYVVTFRQTDPFYVVDLSDPASPKKLGELKVPGFSSYLHPVGEHLVLGAGSDATDEGRVQGAKLSLYDTSDPTAPKELDTLVFRGGDFQVAGDPHAFTWDADTSTAYLPYYAACYDTFSTASDCGPASNGVLVVRVAVGELTQLGWITHDDRTPSPDPSPEETTTTTSTIPVTTVPETTVPDTTVPETSVPETTVPTTEVTPTTVVAKEGDGTSSSSAASSPVPMPMPVDPGIGCDPAYCDPGPIDYPPTITRVFVIGDRIVTLSDAGIAAHEVGSLKQTGFAAF